MTLQYIGVAYKNCTVAAFLMYFQNVSPKMKFLFYLFMNYRLSDVIILSQLRFVIFIDN